MIKDKNFSIISCSPENLITKNGLSISTKPIAGTLRKTKKINKMKALNFFKNNIKETKEHNMIVDMERNDLSRICRIGSVKLSKQKIVEEYKDLFHYVSLIKGKLKILAIGIILNVSTGLLFYNELSKGMSYGEVIERTFFYWIISISFLLFSIYWNKKF